MALGMLTALSINNSPTFQLSKEHILLNIDLRDKSPCFSGGISQVPIPAALPAHPSVALAILGLSHRSASHCKDFRVGAPTGSAQPQILASQLQSPLLGGGRRGVGMPLLSSPTESLFPKPEVWESLDNCRGHKTIWMSRSGCY